MAASGAVWGIDIGQCALKALRCRPGDDGKSLVAEAFDYIEYPKILTQPDAKPDELVREALQQFLDTNSVRDARIAISVSGQSGLARFIKLPPVEAKKIPDIVKYEAKQQIPFSLDDVIWDYQPLAGAQDEGVALETEVGLFAMKRDQVFRALRPFRDAGIEPDIVQLTPIAIYNAVIHGVLKDIPGPTEYDPDNPPKSVVIISMGTDTTDLVITNGFRIWQRSIPIGGSHFTKQLTKEMKLTFAKAEHLKRNAREAEDPKAVFQAMRPVFTDFVQELQRSIGYFRSIDREADIGYGVVLGNAVRLPGLQPYLEKNLDLKIRKVQEYRNLEGEEIAAPKFKDNVLSFGVAYGLCVQGVGRSRLSTNLIPRELITARIVRQKKPWALLALTVLVLGVAFNFLAIWSRWRDARQERFQPVSNQVSTVTRESQDLISRDQELVTQFENLKQLGTEVVGGADARFLVLELFKAINSALPRNENGNPFAVSKTPWGQRRELYIETIDSEYFPTLTEYFSVDVQSRYDQFLKDLTDSQKRLASGDTTPPADDGSADVDAADDEGNENVVLDGDEEDLAAGESDEAIGFTQPELPDFDRPGWVIEISGFHFHNDHLINQRATYLVNTLLDQLEHGEVEIPARPGQPATTFSMKELGIYCPIIAAEGSNVTVEIPNPDYKPPPGSSGRDREMTRSRRMQNVDPNNPPFKYVDAYQFTVQFIWMETPASERLEQRQNPQSSGTGGDVAGNL